MSLIFSFAKKIIGPKNVKRVRPIFHGLKGYVAALRYGFPARKLNLIGINGTKGKTTTTVYLGRMLNLIGIKTGYLSTAILAIPSRLGDFDIVKTEKLNKFKMTSIDAFAMQKRLRQMVDNGCRWVVIEMSSEGLAQNRHWGLFGFDITLFLNAYPEHLEAHGGWDNYLKCKSKLFRNIKPAGTLIANNNPVQQSNTQIMWQAIPNNRKISINKVLIDPETDFQSILTPGQLFLTIRINDQKIATPALARFELDNFFFAYRTAQSIDAVKSKAILNPELIAKVMKGVPGRMEWVVVDNIIL